MFLCKPALICTGVIVSADAFSDTGTVHRVRAACERGLRHKVTRNCPLLWRLYLHFEVKTAKVPRCFWIFVVSLLASQDRFYGTSWTKLQHKNCVFAIGLCLAVHVSVCKAGTGCKSKKTVAETVSEIIVLFNDWHDSIFWTVEPFVTKLSIMMHHHELECQLKRYIFTVFKV